MAARPGLWAEAPLPKCLASPSSLLLTSQQPTPWAEGSWRGPPWLQRRAESGASGLLGSEEGHQPTRGGGCAFRLALVHILSDHLSLSKMLRCLCPERHVQSWHLVGTLYGFLGGSSYLALWDRPVPAEPRSSRALNQV